MNLKRIVDEAKNGVVETYYDNGQQLSRANYKDGNLDGLYEAWYENGQLESRVNYKDDSDMLLNQKEHFFQTDNYSGLTPTICYKIKRFITGRTNIY